MNEDYGKRDTGTRSSNDIGPDYHTPPQRNGFSKFLQGFGISIVLLMFIYFLGDTIPPKDTDMAPQVQTEELTDVVSEEEMDAPEIPSVDKSVKEPKQESESSELSTMELLDRTTHAHAVERAKEAGVSTEGSTSEILDRITHAHAVERAKEAGVSTKGSTSEILDRIVRKHLEEMNR